MIQADLNGKAKTSYIDRTDFLENVLIDFVSIFVNQQPGGLIVHTPFPSLIIQKLF